MFQVLRGGSNSHHSGSFFMSRPEGLSNYVVLIIRTMVDFQIGDMHITADPGQAVVIAPGTPYHYYNPQGDYIDDWLHFQVTDEEWTGRISQIVNHLFPVDNTEFYTNLIRQILWEEAYAKEDYRQQDMDACFTILINHLLDAYENKDYKRASLPYQEQLQQLRLELPSIAVKNVTIKECAERLGISDTYFQHLYSKAFGISFQKDLIRFRIEHARFLLSSTDMTLEQIAELCGYANEVHFYRQFKQLVHMTPAKYRRQN